MKGMDNQPPVAMPVASLSKWHQVTPFTKYTAMALFIVMPFAGFWLGMHYTPYPIDGQQVVDVPAVTPSHIKNDAMGNSVPPMSDEETKNAMATAVSEKYTRQETPYPGTDISFEIERTAYDAKKDQRPLGERVVYSDVDLSFSELSSGSEKYPSPILRLYPLFGYRSAADTIWELERLRLETANLKVTSSSSLDEPSDLKRYCKINQWTAGGATYYDLALLDDKNGELQKKKGSIDLKDYCSTSEYTVLKPHADSAFDMYLAQIPKHSFSTPTPGSIQLIQSVPVPGATGKGE